MTDTQQKYSFEYCLKYYNDKAEMRVFRMLCLGRCLDFVLAFFIEITTPQVP